MYKVLVFDFDYTLGDSTKGIVECSNYALTNLGIDTKPVEEISKTIGLTLVEAYKQLTGNEDEKGCAMFPKYFMERADQVMTDSTQLYEDTKDIIISLKNKGYKIAIVTTKYHHRIEGILGKFQMREYIDMIVGGDDVAKEKPAPDGLLMVIKHFGINPEELLYVGDSYVDAKTAMAAQTDFCAVLTGTTNEEKFAEYPSKAICCNLKKIYDYILENEE